MRTYLTTTLLLLSVLLGSSSFAQSKQNTLLWRINGKGLAKPSYLYGTIHLTDKRLFHFGDSVYAAIEQTEGLAIEINLNEAAAYYIDKAIYKEDQAEKPITELLSKQELKKIAKKLRKKFRKEPDQITSADILREKNKWFADYLSKGEMPTIMDGYLYTTARKQGKWLGGIEDVQDQLDMLDESEVRLTLAADEHTSLETLISLYRAQDLDSIYRLISASDSAAKDRLLVKRNIKMARRMDSLSAFRSMFFAVGAAHLPGEEGVIALLRQRGFIVEPVYSQSTLFANDYTYKEIPVSWSTVTDEGRLYTVEMPGDPASIKLYGLIEMKFLLDMSNLSGYCAMASANARNAESPEEVYRQTASRIFKGEKLTKPQKILLDGVEGVEYIQKRDNYHVRLRLFQKYNILYMTMLYAAKEAFVHTADADRFFSSLTLAKEPPGGPAEVFTDSTMAISFQTPVKLTYNAEMKKQTGTVPGWNVCFYTGMEQKHGAFIMLMSKQPDPGIHILNDSAILEEMFQSLSQSYKLTRDYVTVGGYNAQHLEGEGEEGTSMELLSFVRGNKTFALMLVSSKENQKKEELQQVFKTLSFLPYKEPQWHPASDTARTFSTTAPAAFVLESSEEHKRQFLSYDTFSATSYYIIPDTLSSYIWASSDTSYLNKDVSEYMNSEDSLIYKKAVFNGKDPAVELLFRRAGTGVYNRLRTVLHGNIKYTLTASGDPALITKENKFFDDFRASTPVSFELTRFKGEQLLMDLKSTDTFVRNEAFAALSQASFEDKDLPLLHKAFLEQYVPVYAGSDSSEINDAIGTHLSEIGSDGTVKFISQHYAELAGRNSMTGCALTTLADIHTDESYKTLARLWAASDPVIANPWTFKVRLQDSLPLLFSAYPIWKTALADTASGTIAAALLRTLVDSGLVQLQELRSQEQVLISLSDYRARQLTDNTNKDFHTFALLHLLDTLNTPGATAALNAYLSIADPYLKQEAALALTRKNAPVDASVWHSLATNPSMRGDLYTSLNELGSVASFPKAFLSQQHLAESAIYAVAYDEDAEPVRTSFISQRTATFRGRKYRFYLFKVNFDEANDSSSVLAIAGGYDLSGKSLIPQKQLTGLYWGDVYDKEKVDDFFEAFLAQRQEEEQEAEE